MRLLVLCTVSTGLGTLTSLVVDQTHQITAVGVDPGFEKSKAISGYTEISSFAKAHRIEFLYVEDYSLKSDADREKILCEQFDLVLAIGWQRLIPNWLIEAAPMGALGAHGSPWGIEGGRGRSPQNWAIILGCKSFDLALFSLRPGVDDGPVIMRSTYQLNDWDDISSSYKKANLCTVRMLSEVLANPSLISEATEQQGPYFYLPRRLPSDGIVDWNLPLSELEALCRALTKPYRGMYALTSDDIPVHIWKCQPFDRQDAREVGLISQSFSDGTFLISCGDGRLLVTDFPLEMGGIPERVMCCGVGQSARPLWQSSTGITPPILIRS